MLSQETLGQVLGDDGTLGRHDHTLGQSGDVAGEAVDVRRVLPTSPVGVEYFLTPLGESLREPFGRLYDWTVNNADEIRAHQRDYDQRVQS
ncbi:MULTISPECIES: winged helix-turn-helix transcriptional regulator [unclassified Streptomyces]|uniref:winged helix-turn-helix transcriptional regulator n=1 Tax=unclassified Streptomyces TaxID=2593676 RepID=UPI0033B25DFB